MSLLDDLTWTCMICGAERPDDKIDVAHRPAKGFESEFPERRWNVRYCNDNPECIATAHEEGPWR